MNEEKKDENQNPENQEQKDVNSGDQPQSEKQEVSQENSSQENTSQEKTAAEEVSEVEEAVKEAAETTEEEQEDKKEKQEKIPEVPKFAEPQEDFDWDTADQHKDDYSSSEREDLESIYDKTLSTIDDQEVIDGKIVAMNNREVVVNIGYKSEGLISMNELRYRENLQVGDTVEVYVENKEDKDGQIVFSHRKARILRSWERILDAYDKDEIINGDIKCRTKGGLIVDVFGLETFLPGSQIDVKPIRDYDQFVGKTMEFKVVKVNHEFKNVVVSHKALIQDELEKQKAEIISKLEKGQILEGTVKNITSYGAFIDLGGVDGLIHITDLSWGRINHPEEIVELDQKLNVVILDFDDDKKRIALGLKQLQAHPWESLDPELKVGDKVKGKVVVVADYGAFVEIAPGVEGLLHVSEMSWSQHLRTAHDFFKVGDEVEAVILTLDREERKISLGMKQLMPDPWESIEKKYPVKSQHKATVRNFTNFGIFVELEEGVDGLIHISDLSWSKKISHPAEFTKIGDEIDVIVLDVNKENRRLSLGHKQLEENPWDVFETIFTENSIHKGTVENLVDKGGVITLPYVVEGFAPMKHLKKEDGSVVNKDETLDFKVIEFNKESKRIVVSHSRIWEDRQAEEKAKEKEKAKSEAKATVKAVNKINEALDKATLGDFNVLADLRTELKEEEKEKAEDYMKKRSVKVQQDKTEEESQENKEKSAQGEKTKSEDSEEAATKEVSEKTEDKSEDTESASKEETGTEAKEIAEIISEVSKEESGEATSEESQKEETDKKASETAESKSGESESGTEESGNKSSKAAEEEKEGKKSSGKTAGKKKSTAKSSESKSTAAKSSATKSSTTKKSTTSKSTTSKSTASKSSGTKSTSTKSTTTKKAGRKKSEDKKAADDKEKQAESGGQSDTEKQKESKASSTSKAAKSKTGGKKSPAQKDESKKDSQNEQAGGDTKSTESEQNK